MKIYPIPYRRAANDEEPERNEWPGLAIVLAIVAIVSFLAAECM